MARILHIITRLIRGGAQLNTVMSCAAQVKAGHEVYLAFGPIYGPEGSLLDEARASGAKLMEVKAMRRAVLPMHDLRCYLALRQLIDHVQPDVVHTHSSKAGIVGRAAAWSRQVPVVVHTIHGLPFHDRQLWPVRRAYIALERWAARRCHKLIGITQAMCDIFQQYDIGQPGQFTVIPSGVELARFEQAASQRDDIREQLGISSTAPVVGIVARLDPLKGQMDLLDILPRLREQFPDIRLLIVGDGWQRQALIQRVKRERLEDSVLLTGLATPRQVAQLLAAMDVCALPSYQEGQGRTLVEALAAGCAIVGYGVGGIPEVCINNVTGKLAPIGDKQALADAIAQLLADPDQRNRLTSRGGAHIREHFAAGVMIQRLDDLYDNLLQPLTSAG